MASNVIDRDLGYKKVKRAFELNGKASDPHVVIGLRGNGPAAETHGAGGMTVIALGTIHEFGLGKMPERSFIRAPFDQGSSKMNDLVVKLAKRVTLGKLKLGAALALLGARGVADVKLHMRAGIPPSKADGDPARLKETGQLQNSVDYEVRGV